MAGTINVDTLKADSNLRLQIASANVAFIDANGLTIVGNSLNVGGGRIVVTSNNSISTPSLIGANIVTATGTTALGIAANGQITTANAPFILTGGQIKFPGTQIASGDGNTLDDYEEGTFTPIMSPTTGSWTTFSTTGRYVKVGQTVTVFMSLTITTVGTGSGFIGVDGFPFVAFNPNIGAGNRAGIGIAREDAAIGYAFQLFINGNSTTGNIQGFVTPTTVNQASGYVFQMSIQYIASA
jgi:hypothetical protein